ncbi:MAG TPA: 2-oxoglutarate dehydrogenase, E2 component, dihydrolipoamide succinyltransferase, partial [Kineosporiaceae bacterium]|nr:2-oxoglutarate dehydrogenase, E2 component, dihydrolipoamide succinyltransferase [Kineosporiaceae bacterium]
GGGQAEAPSDTQVDAAAEATGMESSEEPKQESASKPAEDEAAAPAQDSSSDAGSGGGDGGGEGTPVTMPALGESVTEGTVTRWLKQEGDTVEVDEPLLEVSTDKVDTEIPSPVAGVVRKILVGEDETVSVGADLAIVGGSDAAPASQEAPPAPAPQAAAPEAAPAPPAPQAAPAPQQAPPAPRPAPAPAPAPRPSQAPAQAEQDDDLETYPGPSPAPVSGPPVGAAETQAAQAARAPEPPVQRPPHQPQHGEASDSASYLTPLVRRLATEHDVDLSTITGTGVGGRIRKQDVLDAAKAKQAEQARQSRPAPAQASAPAPAASGGRDVSALRGSTEKMSRLRRVIAQRMVESLQVSAQLTTVVEVDVTKIARLRDRAKRDFEAREGVKLSFLPFFALAAVEALKQYPVVNASIEDDQIVYHAEENLGVAVDTERGLLVPVIRNAGDLNIAGIARKISDLADRTRRNKITPDELGGGTFTLTNTGSRGALFDTPIINQPQVAILGTGAVVKRPVVVTDAELGETIAIRSMVYLALTYDHRIVDGADAARFLVAVKQRLEEGAFDADLGV